MSCSSSNKDPGVQVAHSLNARDHGGGLPVIVSFVESRMLFGAEIMSLNLFTATYVVIAYFSFTWLHDRIVLWLHIGALQMVIYR